VRVRQAATLAVFALTCAAPRAALAHEAGDPTFSAIGVAAERTLTTVLYDGAGRWRMCLAPGCSTTNADWGAGALTGALYLRVQGGGSGAARDVFRTLAATLPARRPCAGSRCSAWSDVPEWDAVAAARVYAVTRDLRALTRAAAAYRSVERSTAYARGACPSILYQHPYGRGGGLKTLETDANAVRAALLLARSTGDASYLAAARTRYAAIRRYYLDPSVALYTVYVLDNGTRCSQIPRRFFASVNGAMIWNGVILARMTGALQYRSEAVATALAVARDLADARGVFANLQAENDTAEPLVEAMLELGASLDGAFARAWIARNAISAQGARRADGTYGRFADGPAPEAPATAWQTSGNLALAIAAARLFPSVAVAPDAAWTQAKSAAAVATVFPVRFAFHGSGIALLGTIGERCCEDGHARVLVDGRETFDRTGIWQNKSSAGRALPGSVLFAWRWPEAGAHSVELLPAAHNPKEGGAFMHVRATLVLP
jgi:hypothetical protein